MSQSIYTAAEICEHAGITYRQLDYWDRTGFLRPSAREADGSGTQRLYTERDVARAYAVRVLLDAGVSLQAIRAAVERGELAAFLEQLASTSRRVVAVVTDDALIA